MIFEQFWRHCHKLSRFLSKPLNLLRRFAVEKVTERKYPTDVRSSLFVQMFVACVASTVDPVLLVRLLAHRLVTTPLYPKNSSSITSMSGQDQFPPRTTRSRASSTDTNASTRRKRVRNNKYISMKTENIGVYGCQYWHLSRLKMFVLSS